MSNEILNRLQQREVELGLAPKELGKNQVALGDEAGYTNGVPNSLVKAVIKQESGGNPAIVSKAGAIGLMQLMPDTAKELGVDPWDANQNIQGGTKYLKQQFDKYQDWEKALAAYNAGPGTVDKAVAMGGDWKANMAKIQSPENFLQTKQYVENLSKFSNSALSKLEQREQELFGDGASRMYNAEVLPDPTKGIADENTDWVEQGALNTKWENIKNSFLQGIDQTQQSSDFNLQDDAQRILDEYPDKKSDLDYKLQSGTIDQNTYMQELQELNNLAQTASANVQKYQKDIDSNTAEIKNEPVSKKYQVQNWLVQGQGSQADMWDKLTYSYPQVWGSSASMMGQQVAATFGGQVFKNLSAAALGALAPEPVASKVAAGVALTTALGLITNARRIESNSEVGDALKQNQQTLLENWQKYHPGQEPTEEDLRRIRMQARVGKDQLFNENMALAIPDIVEALIMPGNKLGDLITGLSKPLKGLERGIEAITDASKLSRNVSRFGRLYADYLKEKGEEGFQYAASQRQQDHALNLGLYENQGLISSILTDAYDTMSSINYSPIGVVRNEDGRYSHDPNFQFSEESGGMMSLLGGGAVSIPIGIYKDLRAYSKYTKELTGTPFDHADDKLLRLKTEVLQKAFDTDTVHHLIEGLKSVSQQKDINGNPLLSEEDLQKEISNIKTAYHKYAAVNDYIDTIGGFFDSKESKIAKRVAKQDLFNTIIGLTKANTEEKDLQDQKTKLRLNSKDQNTFNYRDLEHQIKFKEMSIAFLENAIKNSPENALIYDYKKKIEILKEQVKPLKETFKNLEEPKNIIEEAPIELFKINQDLIPVQARKQLHQNNYNKLLNLKNLDDYKKHSEEKLKDSEAKQKALEALNNKIKAESVKDEVKQEAVVNKEKLDAESEDEYEKIMGELITRESNTEAIKAIANTVKSKIEEHKNQINQNTKSVEILQAQLDSNLDSLSSKIDRALKSINYYQAKLQENGSNSRDIRNLKNAREKYKTLISQAKELQDQITDLKETIKTLTVIKQDLENRLQYYNSLLNDPSLKTLTLSELKDKKAKIEKKLSSIEKIISNIKQLLEKSIAYLKEITKVILERFTLLERFKKETKFKPDTDKLRELLNYDKSGIINKPGKERLVNYAALQKQHDLLEEEILNALEHGEISEQALEAQQERLLELQEVRSKYDRQLRYLTDLIKILIDGNKLTEIPKVEKKQATPQILTPQQPTTEFTGKTIQKVDRFGMLTDPAEIEVVSQNKLPDGSIDYTTKTGEVLNTKDGWNETNKIKPSNRTIEGLHGVRHFNDIHRYNLKREQEQLEDMVTSDRGKAEGATKESLLQKHGPKAFPAHFADELLSKILGTVPMSEYKKYIRLKATKVKPTKFGNVVPLGKQVRLRGKRKEGVHIILEITDPQDSTNVYALSHGYNPDFYEYLDEHNNWKPVVFTDMSIDLFKQLFKFNNQEITPETYKEFQDNWKRAKEFNDAAVIYVQQHGDKAVLPDNTFNLTPKGEFDWIGNGTPISATKFPEFQNRAVIYKLAGKEYYVNGITPETAPDGLESGSYYVEAKFPNGKILWVRLFPDTVDLKSAEAQESIDALNTVVTDAHNLPTNVDLETLRPQLNEMLRKLDFFVKSSNSKFNITFRVAKASNEENYSLKVVLVLDEGRGRDNPRQEVQVRNTFTDFTNFKKFLSGLYLTVGDTKVYVGDVTLRKNLPLDTDEKKVTNPLKQLASSTKQGIVKKWGAEFTFYPENFEFKDQPIVVIPTEEVKTEVQIKEVNDFFGVSDVVEPEGIDEILAAAAPNIPAQTVTFTPEQEEIYRSLLAAGISEEDARRTALETGTSSDKITDLIDVSNPFTVQQAREFVQDKFGDAFTVQDINTLVSNAIINGTRVGTVLGKSLYIANGVSRTYTYHEAFHALFNNLLSPRKQFLYRNKIKSELNYTPDQLAKAIADLRSTSSQYNKLSDKEMETRVYEEALADKYADWQNKQKEVKSVWRILFEKIRNFINTLLGNQSIIHLFNRIDSGAFKNSSFKDTRTGEYYKIIKNTSPSESNHIIYTIAAGVLNSQFNKREAGSRILNAFNAYAAAFDLALPHNIDFIKSRTNVSEDLLAMKRFHNKLVQNKDLILSEVTKFLKQQGYKEDVQDFDAFTDDDSEINFDAMSSEYDPSIRVGAQIKKLLATTLYKDFDIFGREVQTALPWREVYNRMLPTLSIASTSPSDIMSTMKAMSAYNKQIHAFYNRIVQLSGYDQDTDGVGVNGKNILTQLKKAFELNKILYMQARDTEGKYELFIENKRDLNETTYGKWKDSYLKIYNKIVGEVKLKDKSLLNLLQNDFVMLEKFLKGQTEFTESEKKWLYFNESLENKVFKVFNNIGVTLEKEYLKFSFSNNPEDIQNREALKGSNIKIISVRDLEFIRQNLDKNVFERQEGLLTDIANANANFDPYAFQKTYTDAEGKKRYSYGLDSLLGVQTRKFKEVFKDVESVKKFIDANKAYWELNPLLSKDPALIVNIMNNFETGLAYDLKIDDNGVTARRINTYDALIYMHALFQNQNSQKYNGIQSAPVVLNQYADKSQQMWGVLPVFKYYDSSTKSFTEQGKTDLWNLFKQEYNRINGVYGNDFLANKKTPVWIHFAMFNNTADTEAMSVLAGAKVDLESVKDRVLDLIKIAVDNEVKDHLQLLTENKLETKIGKDILKLYGDLNGYLYNFTLNNTLSTIGINQLLSGDYANAKNFDDYIKRVSMVNAAGFSYAKDNNPTDMHQVVFVKGSVAYINRDTKEKSYDPQYKDAEGWDEIKTDDAQVYSGLDSYVDDLARQGRLSDKIIEVVNKLQGNVIENGFPVWPTLNEIKEAGVDLIPSKQVVAGFDANGRPVFNKMAVCYITPQLCAKYVNGEFVPLEGKEELFKKWQLLKHIDDRKITHIVPQTAAKLFFPDNALNLKDPIHKDAITISKDQIHNIPNIYRRLQQENDSKEAGKITASNQIENILGSEIKDPATRELLDEHNRINSQMRTQVFNFVQSVLIQNNDRGDMEVLLRKFRSIVEESTPDNQMLEMLEAEGKKMKYDSNLAHLHTKFVDLFLSTYKEVFRQKVPGVKFTAMSSEGYNIKDPKTGQYRPLQGMLHKEGTTIPAEVVVSRKWADERGFRKGDQVILFRVPSQSYHSIATAKIVELLPDAYGDTIIAPSDFVWLMGMDFDVDALYAYKKAYFKDSTGKVIEYGKESTPEEKFDGYIKDLFNNNSYFKAEYSENIENDKDLKEVRKELANLKREIEKDFETRSENKSKLKVLNAVIKRVEITMAFLAEDKTQVEQLSEQLLFLKQDKSQIKDELNEIFQKLKELAPERTEKLEDLREGIRLGIKYNLDKTLKLFNLPNSPEKLIQSGLDSKQALTNKLFDLKWRILNSPELKQAFSEPLAEKSDESIKLGKENDVEHTRINGSPLSILNARQAAVQSKGLVGTAVNGSSFVQFVTQLGLNVSEDYQLYFNGNTYNSFASTEDTRGKFDKISMTLGSIIDGMKKPFAKFLNYDFNTVNKVMLMFGLNIPEKTIDRYFIQPSIKTITKELGKTQRLTNPALPYTKGEEKEGIIVDAELSRIVKALGEKNLPKDFNITDAEMEAALKAEQQKLYTPEYYTTQYKALKLYERLMTLDKTRAHVNRILSTNRSLGTDIEDFHKILEAEKALRPKTSEPEPIPGMLSKIVQNPVLNQNITYVKDALEALTHYDISETKLAKKIFDAFVFSFGKNLSSDDRTEIKRIIIASLQLSTLRTRENTQKFSSLLLKGDNSLSSKLLNYLQENSNNYLLRVLRFEDDEKSGYSKVTMDSRTKFTETTQDNLLNSGGRIAEKNPELYQDMFNYLVFKDSLMFKNGSFVKYMLPEMFLGLAKASQEVNRLLTEENVNEEAFKQLVGMNTREFIDMTIENYIRHSINKNKLRSRTADYYQGTKFDRGTLVFTKITGDKQTEKNSPFIDENGDLKMPKWIKLEGVLLKKVKWDKNSARYEIKTMYGSSERQPYALTPAQNEAFDKAHKEIVAKQKAIKEQENIPPTIWDADMAEAQREFEKAEVKPQARGKMTYSYGNNKRDDVKATTTFEAIKNGERTATTRYESDGHIDYWKKLKVGDIIEFESSTGEKILVEVTRPLHKLIGSNKTPEQWSKLEGWSVNYFNSKVRPKLNEAWQLEYKVKAKASSTIREYTPENITSLKPNEVFVFGSNAKGIHGKGAALTAKQLFGAKQGQAEGLQGQSYGVITKKDWKVEKSSTLPEIEKGIQTMLLFAKQHPEKRFLVTKLGSSLAGYTTTEIKELFEKLKNIIPNNVVLPKEYEVRDKQASPFTELSEDFVPETPKSKSFKDFVNYSGGATGSDTEWEKIGKEYGIGKQVNYRPETLQQLNPAQRKEVEDAYLKVVSDLKRKVLSGDSYSGGLVRRDYLQAKAADAVFAIVEGFDINGYPKGGTAYAVASAINMRKPVYVFDQSENEWLVAEYDAGGFNGSWTTISTPALTEKFAGIGTRQLNEAGKKAIRNVYEQTKKSFNTSTNASMTLKNGKSYSYDQINSKLLEGMGYSIEEIGKILKRIC